MSKTQRVSICRTPGVHLRWWGSTQWSPVCDFEPVATDQTPAVPPETRCAPRTGRWPILSVTGRQLPQLARSWHLRFFDHDTDPLVDPAEDWTITRIGTVGDSSGSTSTLWDRLRAHRGTVNSRYGEMGGNYRGSIFRRHVGQSIIEREDLHDEYPHWGVAHRNLPGDVSTSDIRTQEHQLEQRVSEYIRSLPFLVIDIPGEPGPDCDWAMIEKNLIALVSHARRTSPDLKKDDWLGYHSPRAEIAKTGLWNIQHVSSFYSDNIIRQVEPYVKGTDPVASDT